MNAYYSTYYTQKEGRIPPQTEHIVFDQISLVNQYSCLVKSGQSDPSVFKGMRSVNIIHPEEDAQVSRRTRCSSFVRQPGQTHCSVRLPIGVCLPSPVVRHYFSHVIKRLNNDY